MKPKNAARHRTRLAVLFVLLLWCGAAAAQKHSGPQPVTSIRVSVTILNPRGAPVSGAGVVLRQVTVEKGRMSKQPFDVELHSDRHGKIVVQGFQPGIVLVQVIAPGYRTYGQTFIMEHADEAVHVNLQLPRRQISIYR